MKTQREAPPFAKKPASTVTPAEAGVQNALKSLDSRFRANDALGRKRLLQLLNGYG